MAGLDLNLALVLHALLAERSVSRAAKRLGLSQSATSHALGRLRAALGDPLVVRAKGGIVPTARALAMMDSLAAGLELLEKSLLAPPRFDPATTARRFSIAATDYVEFLLLPRLIGALATEAPKLEVWLRPFGDDPLGELQRGEADLAIGVVGPETLKSNLKQLRLLDERLVCVVRERHPLTRGRLSVARFAAAKHVLIAPRGRPGGPVDTALAARGYQRQIAVAVPHFLAAPHIVAETDLVLTMAARLAASFANVLPLRLLELPFDLAPVRPAVVWHERHEDDPAHAWFRSQILTMAREVQPPRAWRAPKRRQALVNRRTGSGNPKSSTARGSS